MDEFLAVMTGTLAANVFTVVFLYGLWHAAIKPERELKAGHLAALIAPPVFALLGVLHFS